MTFLIVSRLLKQYTNDDVITVFLTSQAYFNISKVIEYQRVQIYKHNNKKYYQKNNFHIFEIIFHSLNNFIFCLEITYKEI